MKRETTYWHVPSSRVPGGIYFEFGNDGCFRLERDGWRCMIAFWQHPEYWFQMQKLRRYRQLSEEEIALLLMER